VENNGRYKKATLRNWTLELVRQLNSISNPIARAFYLWLDSILGGYITKFAIDCIQSYSVVKRDIFKGPRRRLMESLGTWIKMFLCDKCMMKMKYDCKGDSHT